jgi:hypothetical protein
MKVPIDIDTGKPAWTPEEARASIVEQGYTPGKADAYAQSMYREIREEKDREYKLELARKAGSATTQLVMMNGVLMSREEAADVQASR